MFIKPKARSILTSQVVSIAGTLLIAGPALANKGGGGSHDGTRHLDNGGMNRQAIRQIARSQRNETTREIPRIDGWSKHIQRPDNSTVTNYQRLDFSRAPFNGQSQFIKNNGAARAITKGLELDLTSDKRSIVLGDNLFSDNSSYTITIGGEQRVLTSGSKVSAAEFVALQQVADGGAQNLIVDQSGRGVDGNFQLNNIDDAGRNIRASSLVIPESVEVVGNFGRGGEFKLTRDLVNYGTVYALSDKPGADKASIGARNITNNANATISSVIPQTVADLNGAIDAPVDLNLAAEKNLTNSGTISSAGNLTLFAGGQLLNSGSVSAQGDVNLQASSVTNSGSIASLAKSVNFSTASPSDIYVDNTGGTISALNGNINFRDSSYTAKSDTNLVGGNWLSNELNLYSGDGHLEVRADDVSGAVTVRAGTALIGADTPDLYIKDLVTSGDPLIFNTGASISLGNQTTGGGPLSVICTFDIQIQNGAVLNTNNASGDAGDILLLAGAAITPGAGQITVTGASGGGSITLLGSGPIITANSTAGDGGDVTLAAFNGGVGGNVNFGGGGSITSNGSAGNDNGNVLIVGRGSLNVGAIDTSAAGTTNTGNIQISASQPIITGGTLVINDPNGNIITGGIAASTTITGNTALQNAISAGGSFSMSTSASGFLLNPISTTSGSLTILSLSNIDIRNNLTAPGGILLVAGNEIAVISNPATFSTTAAGQAGNVTMVSGASFTDNGATVTINGASGTAGNTVIDLNFGSDFIDARGTGGNANGGNVTMAAFVNASNALGRIQLDNNLDVLTGGTGTGTNGNITLVAGANDGGNGIVYANPLSTAGGAAATGNITLHCSTPGSGVVLSKANAGIVSGSFTGGAITGSSIIGATGNSLLQTDGGSIDLLAGRAIDLETVISQTGLVRLNAVGPISSMNLRTIQAGSLVITSGQEIAIRGSWSTPLTGGGIVAVAGTNISNIPGANSFSTIENAGGTAGSVTLVAGAAFTENAGSITITGASASGGVLTLGGSFLGIDASGSGGASGGDINLVAFADALGANGRVTLDNVTDLSTFGNGAGTNGNILMIGGQNQAGVAIQTGRAFDTTGGNVGTGSITLLSAQPATGAVISKVTGDVTSGSFTTGAVTTVADVNGINGTSTFSTDGAFNLVCGDVMDFTNTTINAGSVRIAVENHISGISNVTSTGSTVITVTTSDITLRGDIHGTGGVVMVAGSQIVNINGGDTITSFNPTGNGGDIVLVSGAAFTQNATSVTITGASGGFSAINLGNSFAGIDSRSLGGNGSGGKVTLVTYGALGGGLLSGIGSGTLLTGGNGTGSNGDVVAISGRNDGATGLQLEAAIDTTGGQAGTGNITFVTSAPTNGVQIAKSNASLTGTFLGGAITNTPIFLAGGSMTTDGATVSIDSGLAATLQAISTGTQGSVRINAGLFNAAGAQLRTITTGALSVTATGSLDLRGGNLTASTGTLLVAGGDIANNATFAIDSSNTAGDAGNIIVVAGATFNQTGADVLITGSSATGGNISLTSAFGGYDARSTGGGGDGGDISLIAYSSGVGARGLINTDGAFHAGGNGAGLNGTVTVLAGNNQSAESIILSSPVTITGGAQGTGAITLKTVSPGVNVTVSRSTIAPTAGTFDSTTLRTATLRAQTTLTATTGVVNILTGRNAIIDNITVSGGTTGNGGSIFIETTGAENFQIGSSGNNRIGTANFDGGTTSGDGGNFTVINNGNTGVIVHGTELQQNNTNGNGGVIVVDADQGALSFNTGPVTIAANAAGGVHDGGTIMLTANNFVFNAGNVSLQTNGSGGGNAGAISLSTNVAINNLLGPGANQFSLSQTGPNSVLTLHSLQSGVNIAAPINVGSLNLSAFNANITQTAGSTVTANVLQFSLAGGTPGIADFDNFANTVGTVQGLNGGTIFLDNGASNLNIGALGSAQTLVASTTGSMSTVSNITTTGDITLNTPDLTNNFAMSADSITVNSQGVTNLTVNGTGTFNATGGGQEVIFNTNGDMTIGGTFQFISVATMNLITPGNDFTVSAGANIVGQQLTTVNAIGSNVFLIGLLTGNPLVINQGGGGGGGTIANTQGDVTLNGDVIINGSDIAIIAAGNIAGTGIVNINTSSGTSGGAVTMLSGFDFTPATPGQVTDSTTTFTNFNPNTAGGSINLNGVNINSSGAAGVGGEVLIVANGGNTNAGNITLGNINASSTTTDGGNISVIGEGTINLGNLANNGTTADNTIKVQVAAPVVTGAPQILNGSLSGGTFGAGAIGNGNITVGTINAGNGSVLLQTNGQNSSIAMGNAVNAGSVNFDAGTGNLNFSNLNLIAVAPDIVTGDGGDITLTSGTMTIISAPDNLFTLNATGFGTGSGGTIIVNTQEQDQFFVGHQSNSKAKSANFLLVTAASGLGASAAGGTIALSVGSNLTVNTASLDAGPRGTGPSDGANYSLAAGSSSSKGGTLIINGNLSSAGLNGGADGNIHLTSKSNTAFTINSASTPKNGTVGILNAGTTGTINVENVNGGILVNTFGALVGNLLHLEAGGKGSVDTASGAFIMANQIELESSGGGIGGKGGIVVNTPSLTVNTSGAASILTASGANMTLQDSFANRGFKLCKSGALTVNDITTLDGDISLQCGTGTLLIAAGSNIDAHNGALLIQNCDAVNGDIFFGAGSTVQTSGRGKDTIVAIGETIPKKPTQTTPPANIIVTPQGKGQAYFQPTAGVVALGATSHVNAINKKVVFSNLSTTPTRLITLNGNVTVTADPPTHIRSTTSLDAMDSLLSISSGQTAPATTLPSTSGLDSIDVANYAQLNPNLLSIDSSGTQLIGNSFTSKGITSLPTELLVTDTSLFRTVGSNQARTINGGITDAYVWCDEELGLESTSMLRASGGNATSESTETEVARLKKGSILLAPSKKTRLETSMGSVEVEKDSVVLVVLDDTRLAVYDLHDQHKGSVQVSSGTWTTALSPGRCTVLTSNTDHNFERANPMKHVGYKSLSSSCRCDRVKVFNAEFSTLAAIGNVKPLRAVFTSKHTAAKRLSDRLIKTSAVLMHVANGEDFKLYAEPEVMAMH